MERRIQLAVSHLNHRSAFDAGAMRHSSPGQMLGVHLRQIPACLRAAGDALDSMFGESRESAKAEPEGSIQ